MAETTFIGNLAADAEFKHTPNGSPVLNFRVIENKERKRQDGTFEKISSQTFNVTVWGSLAEMLWNRGLNTGDRVKVVGDFFRRDYDKQDGTSGVSLDVTAWGVRPYDKRNNQAPNSNAAPQQNSQPQGGQQGGGWPQQQQSAPQQQNGGGWNQQGGNGGGWQQPQQQQQPQQNAQQGGGWNAPAADPWTANANTGGGWNGQ